MAKLVKAGKYGQVELNQVAFRRDGHVEAQAALSTTDFASTKCENGMLLAVDKAANEVKFVATPTTNTLPIALVYSAEHMYDERKLGLGDYYLGIDGGDFYPRLGYLSVGDIFTTNCVDSTAITTAGELDSTAKTNLKAATFGVGTAGYITEWTAGQKLKVINDESERGGWTMPDGTPGIKFQVIA